MESLSEALRNMTVSSLNNSNELATRVLNDPLIEKLRVQYPGLTDQILKANLNRLHQVITEQRNCHNCPGLENCPNSMTGHSTNLSCDNFNNRWQIMEQKTPCKKWLAHEQTQQIRRRITSLYFEQENFNLDYEEEEMLQLDGNRAHAVNRLQEYVKETMWRGLSKRGLYLQGDFGTGKTYLAGYLLKKLAMKGYSGVIVYMPEFVEEAKALIFDSEKLKDIIRLMKQTDLLVFDDIGAENLSPWIRDHVLGTILNARMNGKPTFYTSNHSLVDLERHFSFTNKEGEESHKGQRLMNRIKPYVEVLHITGRNHRE